MSTPDDRVRREQKNAFIEHFLTGVSRCLFIVYLFCSPLFIEDELRRIDTTFNMAKLFLPLLAIVKLFFGLIHVIFRANSKEITKLLVTMIFLSGMVLHSNLNSEQTFKDIYFSKEDADQPAPHRWTFITEYVPALDGFFASIPSVLDHENVAAGMTANVATSSVNSIHLVAYHWLIIIGVVSAICCHMIKFEDYSQIGRMGLSIFYVLFGVCIMVLDEIQRAFVHVLSKSQLMPSDLSQNSLIRILLVLAFVCCGSGASLFVGGRYKKLGIFACVMYIGVLTYYEIQCLLIGQQKRDQTDIAKGNMNVNLNAMLKYHDQYIYPTDYQLLRVFNLLMVLSGTLFEMLKIFSPENAKQSQADYSTVDEEDAPDVQETNNSDAAKAKKAKGKKKNKKPEGKKKK